MCTIFEDAKYLIKVLEVAISSGHDSSRSNSDEIVDDVNMEEDSLIIGPIPPPLEKRNLRHEAAAFLRELFVLTRSTSWERRYVSLI